MDHLVKELLLKEPKLKSIFRKKPKYKIFTHSSVSQKNRQLKHLSSSSKFVCLRDFVDVTTRVNCIKLIDQAVSIR